MNTAWAISILSIIRHMKKKKCDWHRKIRFRQDEGSLAERYYVGVCIMPICKQVSNSADSSGAFINYISCTVLLHFLPLSLFLSTIMHYFSFPFLSLFLETPATIKLKHTEGTICLITFYSDSCDYPCIGRLHNNYIYHNFHKILNV